MCLRTSSVAGVAIPNWEGDRIVHSPVIEAARYVPGTSTRYPIDIREYLSTRDNRLVREVIENAADALPSADARSLFWSTKPGSFDHRVRALCGHLSTRISYKRRNVGRKEWLFPDETLAESAGDCEDHAFLLASTLVASGVSGYVVRVALGKVRDTARGDATDHAWVMYKSEAGRWLLLDPLLYTVDARKAPRRAKVARRTAGGETASVDQTTHEYTPRFVFNDDHLWAVCERGDTANLDQYLAEREFWADFDPSFAASVHDGIYDEALVGMAWIDLQWVKAVSLGIDANIAIYDPRDHFDDAYIDEGWTRVGERLGSRSLTDFALACHAIGDFYAHSSWGAFGARDAAGTLLPLLDPPPRGFAMPPDYSEDGRFPIVDPRFSVNEPVWGDRPRSAAVGEWAGQLVSGRYAQASDPHQGTFERVTTIPKELTGRADYPCRAGLPHHNEIAVDSASMAGAHRLYPEATYGDAFRERYAAAVDHVRHAYTLSPPKPDRVSVT